MAKEDSNFCCKLSGCFGLVQLFSANDSNHPGGPNCCSWCRMYLSLERFRFVSVSEIFLVRQGHCRIVRMWGAVAFQLAGQHWVIMGGSGFLVSSQLDRCSMGNTSHRELQKRNKMTWDTLWHGYWKGSSLLSCSLFKYTVNSTFSVQDIAWFLSENW